MQHLHKLRHSLQHRVPHRQKHHHRRRLRAQHRLQQHRHSQFLSHISFHCFQFRLTPPCCRFQIRRIHDRKREIAQSMQVLRVCSSRNKRLRSVGAQQREHREHGLWESVVKSFNEIASSSCNECVHSNIFRRHDRIDSCVNTVSNDTSGLTNSVLMPVFETDLRSTLLRVKKT